MEGGQLLDASLGVGLVATWSRRRNCLRRSYGLRLGPTLGQKKSPTRLGRASGSLWAKVHADPRHQRDLQGHLQRASPKRIPVQERRLSGVRRTCRDVVENAWPNLLERLGFD